MDPNVNYELDAESLSRFESVLAQHGIRVVRQSRTTFERFDGSRVHQTIHGLLTHDERKFRFQLREDGNDSWFKLNVFEHGRQRGAALFDILDKAFPQRESRPLPAFTGEQKNSLGSIFGCLAIVVVIVAVLFFAILGVVGLFK